MITAGIDLATEPSGTALAAIRWEPRRASVISLELGVDDDRIVDAASDFDKLGIDCPLGWPEDFVRFVESHHTGHFLPPPGLRGVDWRRQLAYRATDRAVREQTGLTPLSVAADRIGLTAMRAAGVLGRLSDDGHPVDRAGSGVVVEVYPAASLKCWDLQSRGYKGKAKRGQLHGLVQDLGRAAPWLDFGPHASLCAGNDDAFDSVIAALTSRAAAIGRTKSPGDPATRRLASIEGWIALPAVSLSSLILC